MTSTPTVYGDITPRTAAYAVKELLKRAIPYLCLERYGQTYPLPSNKTIVAKFRRYNSLTPTTTPLTEGVTPDAHELTSTDYTATLSQYGDRIQISDVIEDTHEDPVLQQCMEILGEQAATSIEMVRQGVLVAGTNVFYSNGSARNAVNTPITLAAQRKVTRALKQQNARKITNVVKSTPSYGTEAVAAAYIGYVHPDVESDIRNMVGFVPVERYGTMTPWENEIGKVEDVRYVSSTVNASFADAGGAEAGSGTAMLSTSGTDADVYPVLYFAANAYGIVPLKGKSAITPMVVNPKPSDSDPLAQRGHASWKAYQAAVRLNEAWMARLEVAVTA